MATTTTILQLEYSGEYLRERENLSDIMTIPAHIQLNIYREREQSRNLSILLLLHPSVRYVHVKRWIAMTHMLNTKRVKIIQGEKRKLSASETTTATATETETETETTAITAAQHPCKINK